MNIASELHSKPAKPCLAYLVATDDPEEQVICFAATNVAARRSGANEIGTDFSLVTCKREKWADQYAETGIPDAAYIANGWFVGCFHCGASITADSCNQDDDGNEIPHEPVFEGCKTYCTPSCQAHGAEAVVESARLKQEAIDCAVAKFPGVSIISASDHDIDRWVDFTFPGGVGRVTWRLGDSHISMAPRDQAAWQAFCDRDKETV